MSWGMVMVFLLVTGTRVAGAVDPVSDSLWNRMAAVLQYEVRMLGYGTAIDPVEGAGNPDNRIMRITRYGAFGEARPDFRLDLDEGTFLLQTRAVLEWERCHDGPGDEEEHTNVATHLYQGLARWRIIPEVYLSWGRENLQWGPAYLTSLSNPFFRDNGRSNPKMELAAGEFGRAVWVPNAAWSASLIVQTGRGASDRNAESPFEVGVALKLDYNGSDDYGSLILYGDRDDHWRIGGFYGRTISEALLVYTEGAFIQHPDGFYPERTVAPLGYDLQRGKDIIESRWALLWGGSYTLDEGLTLSVEYLYYGPGYNGSQADRFLELRERARRALLSQGPSTAIGYQSLGRSADPGLRFLRQNYFMLQCVQNDIAGKINLTGRWTQNLDDGSGRFTGFGEWAVGDHVQFFTIGTFNRGGSDSEFGGIFRYHFMIGMEYTF